jgi:hypothetical protein
MDAMKRYILTLLIIVGMIIGARPERAEALILPDPEVYAMTYGDFYSYSLPVLAYLYFQETGTGETSPQNPYYVQSGPGQIKDSVVLATGITGKDAVTNPVGMENAYETPNYAPTDTSVTGEFYTATATDPANNGTLADSRNAWDANIASMVNYLGGGSPIFFFNNNQIKGSGAEYEDLWVFAQIKVWSSSDPLVYEYFDLVSNPNTNTGEGTIGGDPEAYDSPSNTDDTWTPDKEYDYVLSGGKACIDGGGSPVSCGDINAVAEFDHNLGADNAAYAVIVPELNDLLADWDENSPYDMFSMEINMYDLNNGYEQVFMLPGTVLSSVPEPSTWLLLGLGLLGLPLARRMRRG